MSHQIPCSVVARRVGENVRRRRLFPLGSSFSFSSASSSSSSSSLAMTNEDGNDDVRRQRNHHQHHHSNRRRHRMISSKASLTIERVHDDDDDVRFGSRPRKEDLTFGTTASDHMLTVEYHANRGGWGTPRITPYRDLLISPAATCLHYGASCFEGMKAFRSLSGDSSIRLFRPELNVMRLKQSMERLDIPGYEDIQVDGMLKCLSELVKLDRRWIPYGEGYSLYIRPNVISTHADIRLVAPESALLYVLLYPVGPYYKNGFQPVRLTAETPYVRAWPGGTGNSKVGGNYAPTVKATASAQAQGSEQVLWLFGPHDHVTEVGTMNIFFAFDASATGAEGGPRPRRIELVTPPLDRGDVLPGVTRRSVIELVSSWTDEDDGTIIDVVERDVSMVEVRDAVSDGRLLEAFGTGTAAVVSPVSCIRYMGRDIDIPTTGSLTQRIWDELTGIQYGTIEGPEGWSVKIDEDDESGSPSYEDEDRYDDVKTY